MFFFQDPPTTESYTLSLHDALPIFRTARREACSAPAATAAPSRGRRRAGSRERPTQLPRVGRSRDPALRDRKSTRLNSSHLGISYAVFCLKKKTTIRRHAPNEDKIF